MRRIFRFKEAAEKFYGGDEETLRHSLLLGVVRAKVELCDPGQWVWWADDENDGELPDAGESATARWRPIRPKGTYQLEGWFVLDRARATRLAHGRMTADLIVSATEEEERFCGATFRVDRLTDLNDLWFEPSEHPERVITSDDETLDYMAENIGSITSDPRTITRYEAAANVGTDGMDVGQLLNLIQDFDRLNTVAVAKAAMNKVQGELREERARGGRIKAAKATPNPEKAIAQEIHRKNPHLSATQIKLRAKLRASDRTIRGWVAEAC